jgi:hypothetical protein
MALFRCQSCHAVYEDHYPPDDTCIQCKQGLIRIVTNQQPKEDAMHQITPTIKLFTSQDNDTNAITINSLYLDHQDNHYQFAGGSNDTIYVFTQGIAIYLLSTNATNGTMSLNAFMVPEPDPINSIYLHNEQHIKSALGHGWNELSPTSIIEKLIDFLI